VIIRFPAYRRFSEARIEVNDAMMALLIGARLGEHALSTTAASPDALLPSLFGRIPGIERFNRTAGDAAKLLAGAEEHLAYMAIPYALAIYGSFLVGAAGMLREDMRDMPGRPYRLQRQDDLTKLSLELSHEYIAERCGATLDGTMLPLFHVARRVRNRVVHFGGAVGSHLLGDYRALSPDVRSSWERLAGRSLPAAVDSGRLALRDGELIAVLAITRNLGHAVNDLLARTLSRGYWARLAVSDYRASYPERFGERDRRLRRLRGHANRLYGPLRLSDEELLDAGK